MKLKRWLEPDLLVAGIIFLATGISSVYAYAYILEMEKPGSVLVSELQAGTSRFGIVSAGSCIGSVVSHVSIEQDFHLRGSAFLKVTQGRTQSMPTSTLEALFNPLGQLNASKFAVKTPELDFILRTREINPIKISLELRAGSKKYFNTFEIPGPVLIEKSGKHSVRITYPGNSGGTSQYGDVILQSFPKELQFSLIPLSAEDPQCSEETARALDLTRLYLEFQTRYGGFIEQYLQRKRKHD